MILSALLGGRRLRSPDSEVRFTTTSASGLSSDLESRLFTGQQSNTSVMLGDTAILKLFRRLELGHNLDIEVHPRSTRSASRMWRGCSAGSR